MRKYVLAFTLAASPAMADFARHWQNAVGSGKIVLIADYGNFPQRRVVKPETGASTPGATA